MPLFKCSIQRDDDDDEGADRMMNKLQGLKKNGQSGKGVKGAEVRLENREITCGIIPTEVVFDNIVKFLDGRIVFNKLRLICSSWNNIILGNGDFNTVSLELSIEFSRQKILCEQFYSIAQSGIFKNVTRLTLKAIHQGLIKAKDKINYIPGHTIVTRGYREQEGGNILKFFPNLKMLNLNGNEIPEERFNWFKDLKSNQLEELLMEDNKFGSRTCQHLNSCENLINLTVLNLRSNSIGNEGCRLLSQTGCLQNIKVLDISSNEIFLDGLLYISKSCFSSNLTTLRANDNSFNDNLYDNIKDGNFKFMNLKTLFLRNCNLSLDTQKKITDEKSLISNVLDRVVV